MSTTTNTPPKKRVHVKTWGCQMNVYDSERMTGLLKPLGYETTETPEEADLVILNTCHIREKAAEKVYSELGRLKDVKARGGTIAVAGCVAQAEGGEMQARAPQVDFVIGPQSYHKLPEIVARSTRESGESLYTDFDVDDKFDRLADRRDAEGYSAFVTVQEGCDKFCTFCVVPYTRGAEVSRSADAVTMEVRQLVQQGVREVTLLGQNVNAWHGTAPTGDGKSEWGLGELVRHIAKIDGLERIRFTTSHPADMDDGLLEAFGEEPKLMPYLHLPVQAGNDGVLKAMNRAHTAESYIRQIEAVRKARPDIAISGDMIVGFPGEDEAAFEDTMALVREVNYASCFSFKYSRRPGTPGATMAKQVPEDVKSERLQRLQALLNEQRREFDVAQVGRTLPVLFDKVGRMDGQLLGKSPYLQSVHVIAPQNLLGEIVPVTIVEAGPNSLRGELTA